MTALRRPPLSRRALATLVTGGLLAVLGDAGARAQIAQESTDPLARLVVTDSHLAPATAAVPIDPGKEESRGGLPAEVLEGWEGFRAAAGGPWQAYVDPATGRLAAAEGAGIPWIPGRGNSLTRGDVEAFLDGRPAAGLAALERIARAFLPRVAPMLGVDDASLALSRGRSGELAAGFWSVDFDVLRGGQPVEGARVVFRVSQGNLVQLGAESLPPPEAAAPPVLVSQEEARAALGLHIGGFGPDDDFLDPGSLRLLPIATGAAPPHGRGLVQVWQLTFTRRGSHETWRGRVDATTGALIEFVDVNRYARARGGVYLDPRFGAAETVRPLPFIDLSTSSFTDSAGRFPESGAVTSTLSGRYVRIADGCGPISLASGPTGSLDFGTNAGSNCSTPGIGGPGNTHAARTELYHLNRIKEVARGWLPDNAWLDGQLEARVNVPGSCNAFWNGTGLIFFWAGGGCGNIGELPGISLHELGHGLDENDGAGFSPDLGTAESYGDVTAALATHNSCTGPGFFAGNCNGYGDACLACRGVRELDWAKRASGQPHTVGNFTQLRCANNPDYPGPCLREGHCEGYVISEAVWDLAARDLPGPGGAGAWALAERLWYTTRPTAGSAFTCHTQANPWTSDGCGVGSLWRVLRAADDDDGNLANGTPHSCQLFAAFNRHGLACPADPGASTCHAACTPPPAPALGATAGDGRVDLAWTSAGAGLVYDVFRNEMGCDAGFARIATGLPGTALTDTATGNGVTYYYQVIAHPAGSAACAGPPSACVTAVPQPGPCAAPAPPAGVVASPLNVGRTEITWSAVAGADFYQVLRATASGGPYTTAGSVIAPATRFVDRGLADQTTYFYVVRAVRGDECLSASSAEASVTTAGCTPRSLYAESFEAASGLAGWVIVNRDGHQSTSNWRGVQACSAPSGTRAFRFGGAGCADAADPNQLTSAFPAGGAGFAVPPGAGRTRLSFRHAWDFEEFFDGGALSISVDGGPEVWLEPGQVFSGAGFNGQVFAKCEPGDSAGIDIFTGTSASVETTVDLDAACDAALQGDTGCAGHSVRVGFTAITDCVSASPGWRLDDVAIATCEGAPPPPPLAFQTLLPCRLLDTRQPGQGPALGPGEVRTLALTGACGVPPGAKALSVNLTVTQAQAAGYLLLFPADHPAPLASTINFGAGMTRSNNAVVSLAGDGTGAVKVQAGSAGAVHLILDVNGYFQ